MGFIIAIIIYPQQIYNPHHYHPNTQQFNNITPLSHLCLVHFITIYNSSAFGTDETLPKTTRFFTPASFPAAYVYKPT